jgi:acyl-coenzyme A thioesterase PaaI-like protein
MKHRIVGKQPNSKMCFLCGLKNAFGLKGQFYGLDNNEVICFFKPAPEHQGYPGRLHGGIAAAALDETIGRAIMAKNPETAVWGVTIEFTTRYKKPVPLNGELRVVGRVTNETSRTFEGTGELLLPEGEIAVTGTGKYLKMPLDKISGFDPAGLDWKITRQKNDPETVSF